MIRACGWCSLLVMFAGCAEQPSGDVVRHDGSVDGSRAERDGLVDRTPSDVDAPETDGPVVPGDDSIAAAYPDDEGIEQDPRVIFAEDFESGNLESILARWTSAKNEEGMSLAADSPQASSGARALEMTRIGGNDTGGDVRMRLGPMGEDHHEKLHLRYYIKLDAAVIGQRNAPGSSDPCEGVDGRPGYGLLSGSHHHTGGGLAGVNHNCDWSMGRAGIRPTGGSFEPACPADSNSPIYDNRFSARLEVFTNACEDFRNDRIDFYSYWMGMHNNASSSLYYGNSFVNDYGLKFPREAWTCVEIMLKINNPNSASNGELKLWVDGEQIAHMQEGSPQGKWLHSAFLPQDSTGFTWNEENYPYPMSEVSLAPFEGFQWRDSDTLKLNVMSLAYYVTKDIQGNARVWYDNVVLATDYIGPIR